jgi:hypothetical protein
MINNNNSKSIYSLNLVCLSFKLNDDIKRLIYEKIKEISVDIIIREWFKYIKRVIIIPCYLLLEISKLKLISDSNILETIKKIHLIQKNLNTNMIDKAWWQKNIFKIKTKIMMTNEYCIEIHLLLDTLIK